MLHVLHTLKKHLLSFHMLSLLIELQSNKETMNDAMHVVSIKNLLISW